MTKVNERTLLAVASIISLSLLEVAALLKGLDGQIFSLAIALIAGLGGYELAKKRMGNEANLSG